MSTFSYGMRYWKKHVPCAVFCQVIGFIALTIDVILPLLGAMFVDYILNYSGITEDSGLFSFLLAYGEPESWRLFFVIAGVFAALELFREGLMYLRNVLFQYNGLKFENELRDITYKKLVDLDSSTVASYNTGELLTTLSADIITFKEMYSSVILMILDGAFILVITCITLAMTSAYMLILPAVIAPFLLVTLVKYTKAARRVSTDIRDRNADVNLNVQENINAVRLIRSFANEGFEENKFDKVNAALRDAYCAQADVAAKYGAADVLGVDISEEALEVARENAARNGLNARFEAHNCFDFLREQTDAGEKYDLVILDPPAFTKSRQAVESALRGYKEINLRGLKLTRPGGFLVTCSCSQHVSTEAFQEMVNHAARDAKKRVRLVEYRTQALDHPILPAAPETKYLKCMILQVMAG